MMGSHQLSLNPSKNSKLSELVDQSEWTKLHFVNPECGCSERVVKSLLNRRPSKDVTEKVFILGNNEVWKKSLADKGYVTVMDSMDHYAEKYSISAVPQLVILNQKQEIFYAGGYSSKRGPAGEIEDIEIFKEATSSKEVKERPIYGCVNGKENQNKSDLIGAKYKRTL